MREGTRKAYGKIVVAVCLVLCLCITEVPMFFAEAAAKITLKSGAAVPDTVYVTKTYALAVSGQKVKFYSSNKAVATVGLTGGRLTPKAPGTVTITAKNYKTGKTFAKKTITVKQRCMEVTTDVTDLYL